MKYFICISFPSEVELFEIEHDIWRSQNGTKFESHNVNFSEELRKKTKKRSKLLALYEPGYYKSAI